MLENNFIITDNAAKQIKKLTRNNGNSKQYLRIEVQGGGCSGFKYNYSFESENIKADDIVFKKNDIIVIVDSTSFSLLENSTLDYIENLDSEYFEIKNPNAKSGCGCGNSFSI